MHRNYANCGSVLARSGLTARGGASSRCHGRVAVPGGEGWHRGDSREVYIHARGPMVRTFHPRMCSIAVVSLRGDLNGWHVVFVVGCCGPTGVCRRRSRPSEDDCRSNWSGAYLIFYGYPRVFIGHDKIARIYQESYIQAQPRDNHDSVKRMKDLRSRSRE